MTDEEQPQQLQLELTGLCRDKKQYQRMCVRIRSAHSASSRAHVICKVIKSFLNLASVCLCMRVTQYGKRLRSSSDYRG